MMQPLETLDVRVQYFDGQAEGDDGHPYYVASCDAINIVTQGDTLDELFVNLKEVIALALEEEDTVDVYNVVPNPKISITMELPDCAQIA
jgi:predicted RNase H-like HicB family nuclease